jgi:hypothetical protein
MQDRVKLTGKHCSMGVMNYQWSIMKHKHTLKRTEHR